MNKMGQFNIEQLTDEELFNESARRLKVFVENLVGDKFTYGVVEFVYHAGHFVRIDCKPSVRGYVNQNPCARGAKNGR